MTQAAMSVAIYGGYLLATGIAMLTVPNLALGWLGLPSTEEPWIRVLGLIAGEVGFYFIFAARAGLHQFFIATVWGRAAVTLAFLLLVTSKLGPIQLLAFAAVDLVTAAWTYLASKKQSTA